MNANALQTKRNWSPVLWINAGCVFAGALIIRLLAARSAYPACGDAQHFVDHGHIIAQGDWSGLSTYWSQGQQLVAAFAFRIAADPHRALQAVTIFSGSALVLGIFVLTLGLTGKPIAAWAAAVVAGLNPLLVNLSITGYSEMPCLAAWVWGAVLLLRTLRRGGAVITACLAGVLFAVAITFRLADALILLAGLGLMITVQSCVVHRRLVSVQHLWFGIAMLVCAVFLLPLILHSQMYSGELMPSSKVHTITLGLDEVYDSKHMYALDRPMSEQQTFYEEHGMASYLWVYRGPLIGDFLKNLTQLARTTASHVFPGPVRLGPATFLFLLFALTLTAAVHGSYKAATFSLLLVGLHTAAISLYFIFTRYAATTISLLAICIGAGIWPSLQARRLYMRVIAFAASLLYIVFVGRAALNAFQNEFQWWHYKRAVAVANEFASYLGPEDTFMAYTLVIPQNMGIYDKSRYHGIPYASWEDIKDICEENEVRFLIASDLRPHWPISEIVLNPLAAGDTWVLRHEWEFHGVPWIDPPERVVLLERKRDLAE